MKIIELTEKQFNNYSKIHSKRNLFQTIEYAKAQQYYGFNILYLGLVDSDNNLSAATLLLEQNTLNRFKIGYVPGGFLIDYNNFKLLKDFTNELKEYLTKNNYIYVRTNSMITIKEFHNDLLLKEDNSKIIDNLKKLNYNFINLNKNFIKYKTIINNYDKESIFNNFKRNVKRKIEKASKMGITIVEGNINNLETFYDLIKKKDKKNFNYYKNIIENFNTKNNKAEIYFAILDGRKYINNYTYLLNNEQIENSNLNYLLSKKSSNKILNRKMISDKRIIKYNTGIKEALSIKNNYPNGLILSGALVLKNNKEIMFLTTGYEEKFRHIKSKELLIWEIIKKYSEKNYNIFNLGELSNNIRDKKDKYHNYNKNKLDYNGNIVEYSEVFDLVINNFLYKLLKIIRIFNLKKKDLNK